MADGLLGTSVELAVGGPAQGGACIAHLDGRVVFVRHALPGEQVRAVITEDREKSFLRADAVEIRTPSPDRVDPPCPHAGPGRCGGCDWQHASGPAQRELKATVLREQFGRLAGIAVEPVVEELPGGLLGWRTRATFAVDGHARPGMHRHRSHEIEHVTTCPIAVPEAEAALARNWPGATGIEVVRDDDGAVTLLAHRPGVGRQARGRRPPDRVRVAAGPARLVHRLGTRRFETDAAGFWQVHPAALQAISAALLSALACRPGERVLELYAGAGALTALLAEAVGPTGHVVAVELVRQAVDDAVANLADLPQAAPRRARVDPATVRAHGSDADIVVLDPPRAGAGKDTMQALLGLAPRAIGYVSCDPATLARDVRVALDGGWRLSALRAFDAFPMTQHIECVALLEPGRTG